MKRVALIVGGGVSQDVVPLVVDIIAAAGAEIDWQRVDVPDMDATTSHDHLDQAVAAVESCGVGLKTRLRAATADSSPSDAPGPLNPNVVLRQRLGLFAGVFPIKTFAGLPCRYPDLDLVLIRENTEDIYKGIEHEIVDGVVESLKVVTRQASERIARFAFDATRTLGRHHVTFIHKANIMKMSDGLFLEVAREVAAENPDIGFREIIVDAACMQLVLKPSQFDVLLSGNLYGDILSNLGSGLAGGISSGHSVNIGERFRVYEAIHGDAPQLEGTGMANPLPILAPAIALLEHLGCEDVAAQIERAISRVLTAGEATTPDLGGRSTSREMVQAILSSLDA